MKTSPDLLTGQQSSSWTSTREALKGLALQEGDPMLPSTGGTLLLMPFFPLYTRLCRAGKSMRGNTFF